MVVDNCPAHPDIKSSVFPNDYVEVEQQFTTSEFTIPIFLPFFGTFTQPSEVT